MKSKLLVSAVGLALLGSSALALADRGHGRDHGPRPDEHRDFGHRHDGSHREWSHHERHYGRGDRHDQWRWHRREHAWYGPYYRDHSYAPRHGWGYDDGVTIIFKGRLD